ncbi:MAG: hypothetical protein HC809_07625 [Gammaproteobacteria bacterium]|nr:hypothetical protein [Gammaproteobacteria bacterium]
MTLSLFVMCMSVVIANNTYDPAKRTSSMLVLSSISAAVALAGYWISDDMAKGIFMVPAVFLLTCGGVYLVYYFRQRIGR